MSAPVIVWIAPGIGFAPDAAASARRLAAALGRMPDANSTYRDWDTQERMWKAWEAWVTGRGPKPPHSRAIHPKYSKHCLGLAWDTDDWVTPGFLPLAADHGWIQVLPNDKTERHHLEYQWWRDKYRSTGSAGGGSSEEEWDMATAQQVLNAVNNLAEIVCGHGASIDNPNWAPGPNSVMGTVRNIAGHLYAGGPSAADPKYLGAPGTVYNILKTPTDRDGQKIPWRQEIADAKTTVNMIEAQLSELGRRPPVSEAQVKTIADAVAAQLGKQAVTIDYAKVARAVNDDVARRMGG